MPGTLWRAPFRKTLSTSSVVIGPTKWSTYADGFTGGILSSSSAMAICPLPSAQTYRQVLDKDASYVLWSGVYPSLRVQYVVDLPEFTAAFLFEDLE